MRPLGYRAPGVDVTVNTVDILLEHGFQYDASFSGTDFEPYYLRHGDRFPPDGPYEFGETVDLVGIPFSWGLSDFQYFEFVPGITVRQDTPSAVYEIWHGELEWAHANVPGGVYDLTMHPQAIGRGHRLVMVERLIEAAKGLEGATFERLGDYAARWRTAEPTVTVQARQQGRTRRRELRSPPHPRPRSSSTSSPCRSTTRRPDGEQITRLHARGGGPDGARPPVPGLPPGRPGLRGAAADEPADSPGWMERALKRLPRPAARPARHRPLDAGRRRSRARPPTSRPTYLDALPRRLDRARRGADPRGELGVERWSVLGQSFGGFCVADLPVDRAGGPARGAASPAACRRSGGRSTTSTRATYRARARAQPPLLRALPGRPRAGARAPPPARDEDVRLPVRRPADLAPVPPARHLMLGMSDGAERLHYLARAAARLAGVPARRRARDVVRAQPDLRDAPRVVLRRRRRHALVGRAAAARRARTPDAVHRRARLPVDVRGLRRAARRSARPPELLAAHEWPRLYDAGPCSRATRSRSPRRSTPNDLYVARGSPRRRRRASAALRPWMTNEYEHNGLRADGERVLGRLIALAALLVRADARVEQRRSRGRRRCSRRR